MRNECIPVLHDYVRSHNQMEINYSIEEIYPLLLDQKYMDMQQKRLRIIKEWHQSRGIQPKRNETNFKIMRIQENNHEVIIDLALKLQSYYLLHGKEHHESRIELERITISNLNRSYEEWFITRIEVKQQERLSAPHYNSYSEAASSNSKASISSTPYLNRDVLSRSEYTKHSEYPVRAIKYDRDKVKAYADKWWDHANPDYINFDVDCTNFVSQCLYAGNAPMDYTGKRNQGWWYRGQSNQEEWSISWSVAHSLQWYLAASKSGLQADLVKSADQLTIGDVIIYDWDGNSKYQHSTIVAALDAEGMPLVNAHTGSSKHRYWDYRDSYAWSDKTKYRLFHIKNSF